jgi:uncharacterized protein (DUF849 family)
LLWHAWLPSVPCFTLCLDTAAAAAAAAAATVHVHTHSHAHGHHQTQADTKPTDGRYITPDGTNAVIIEASTRFSTGFL